MFENWENKISSFLSVADRLVIIGIGNPEKGDDAAGIKCADRLKSILGNDLPHHVKIINAGVMPENFTGDIRRFRAEKILIIDAVIAGHAPGTIFVFDPDQIVNEDVSTHRMPLSMLNRFLKESIGCQVLMIGIEPKEVDLDITVSKSVQNSIELLVNHLFVLLFPKNK
jgi:hydrogenase 3 maturation protease